MERSTTSPDAFLASLPDAIRDDLVALVVEMATRARDIVDAAGLISTI